MNPILPLLAILVALHGAADSLGATVLEDDRGKDAASDVSKSSGTPSLSAASRVLIGLRTEPALEDESAGSLEVFGRVLDLAPIAALLFEREARSAALAAAESEERRVRSLHRDGALASQRELEAAVATRAREEAALADAEGRIVLSLGPLAPAPGHGAAFARDLLAGTLRVGRLEVPLGETTASPLQLAHLASLAAPDRPLFATRVAPAPTTDPASQGTGVLLLLPAGAPPPGTGLIARLLLPEAPRGSLSVPAAALVREAGHCFVYVEVGPGYFERRAVELGAATEGGWRVHGALQPGDAVVVEGAQELLSQQILGPGAN